MPHQLTWLGHSAFKLETGGKVVFIDPFLEGNPKAPLAASAIHAADAILVTHDHPDHSGQAVDIARRTGATVVAMYDTVAALQSRGLPEAQGLGMNIGGTALVHGLRVKMVQAAHSSASGVAAGYILTLDDGFCLYHAGDTGIFSSMELFGRFHQIDLALLPIGGHFTMDAEQAAYACKLLGARRVIAMHWGTFPVLAQNTAAFAEQLARLAPDTHHFSLTPGQSFRAEKTPDDFDCGCD